MGMFSVTNGRSQQQQQEDGEGGGGEGGGGGGGGKINQDGRDKRLKKLPHPALATLNRKAIRF